MARETDRETHEEIRLAWLHWSGGTDPLDTQTIAVLASPDGKILGTQSVFNRMRRNGVLPVKRGSSGAPTLWARADVIEAYPALGAIDD